METQDLEVIIPSEDPTVATISHLFIFVTLLLSLYLFILHLWNRPVLMKYLLVLEPNTFHRFLVILLTHLPVLSPQLPTPQITTVYIFTSTPHLQSESLQYSACTVVRYHVGA